MPIATTPSLLDGPAGQQLGLGTGHEDARPDEQLDVPEAGGAGQVLERLARRAARHQRVVLLGLVGRRYVVDERQPGAVDAEDVGEQRPPRRASGDSTPASREPGVRPRRPAVAGAGTQRPSRLDRVEPGGEVGLDAGVDDRLQVAVEHLVEVVGLVAGAVVGDAVLREVVGADPLGAVDGADLAAARLARLGVGLVLGGGEQPGPQDAQRLLLVLQLALLVLAADHDAGRDVGDPDGRVGGVDALAAGAAAAEDVDAQVVLVDLDVDVLGLGHHQHAGGAGVDAALRLGDRHPLHAVDAALELQQPVRRLARLGGAPAPSPRR